MTALVYRIHLDCASSMVNKKYRAEEEEEVYNVERIMDKKIQDGRVYYLLKWEGYPDSENTWEAEENVFCKDLIEEYENNVSKVKKQSSARKPTVDKPKVESISQELKGNHFNPNGWEGFVERILTLERVDGELLGLVAWRDNTKSLHPLNVININCPQKMLKFYEQHLRFKDEEE